MIKIGETRNLMTISAIVPVYNGEKYISRCIDSVLQQSRPADEIIVVDDGSTDGTAEIVKGYGDKVRYFYQKNAGVSAARNKGVSEARCEWISFIDCDDEWLEENLEMLAGVVTRNDSLVWAFGDFINCYCKSELRSNAHKNAKSEILREGKEFFDSYITAFKDGFHVSMISNIVKRSVFDNVGLFVIGQHRAEDTDLWLRIAYEYPKVGYVGQPLAIYHRDIETSMTSSHRNFDIISEMIDKHLKLSAEKGFGADFVPCASSMLGVWIREMLSTGDAEGLLETVRRYDWLLSWRFKKEMWLRVKHPRVAPTVLAIVSSLKKCKHFVFDRFDHGRK